MADQLLPSSFYVKVKEFLEGYKKEIAKAKKEGTGQVDENSADPISFSLYNLLLQWALEENNVIVWHC